jgi:hypothetical protein
LKKIGGEEVPDEPHGVPVKEAAGYHQWGGQLHKVLARGEVHPKEPFQSQNRIYKEKASAK